jgi:gentisate 1,2-dioxygenase
MFVLPSWAVHEHANASEQQRAILFAVHDTPLLRAVDKYRIAAAESPRQCVTGSFRSAG